MPEVDNRAHVLVAWILVSACRFTPGTETVGPSDAELDAFEPAPGSPAAPTDLAVTIGDHQLGLAWIAPSDDGGNPITAYTATAVPDDPALASATCSDAATACTLTGLANGTTYTIRVSAMNVVGMGAASTPPAVAMPIPTLLGDTRLQLWLDAMQADSLTAIGNQLTDWHDRSPNNRTASQAAAGERPMVESAVVTGRPAVTFDGIDDGMSTNGFLTNNATYTIFATAANRDATLPIANHASVAYATMTCGSTHNGFSMYTYTSFTGATNVRVPNVESGNSSSHTVRINGDGTVAIPNGATTTTPGVEVAQDAWMMATQQVTINDVGGTNLFLGRYRDGCQFGHVSLGELLVFDRVFQTAEVAAIEEYLAHKWGVTPAQ
ncbi:MAG: fibronectin type III domain-containing protein [Kofleriaceae bacterium]